VTIGEYLKELERRLPRFRRRRILAEAEEHLRDSAARHRASGLEQQAAEAAAVRSFGDVSVVASRVAAETAILEIRAASAVAVGTVLAFVFPLYVVPENTLPPATWIEKPRDIFLLQVVAILLWAVAGVLAATSAIFAWTRWSWFAAAVLELVPIALAGSILASVALVVRWFMAGSGIVSWPLFSAPLALGCLAACAGTAAWAHSRRSVLPV
jgi:hypothetical protein